MGETRDFWLWAIKQRPQNPLETPQNIIALWQWAFHSTVEEEPLTYSYSFFITVFDFDPCLRWKSYRVLDEVFPKSKNKTDHKICDKGSLQVYPLK